MNSLKRTAVRFSVVTASLASISPLAAAFGEVVAPTFIRDFACYTAPTLLANKAQLLTVHRLQADATGIARIRPDGSLDSTFGQNGIAMIPNDLNPGEEHVPVGDGKTLVVGRRIVRINADGSVDTAYGSRGATDFAFPNTPFPYLLSHALQADGSIVLHGRESNAAGTQEVVFTRFDANGMRDAFFGEGGFVRVPSTSGANTIYAWSAQSHGGVDVASYSTVSGAPMPSVKRFSPYRWISSEFQPGTRLIPAQGLASWTSSAVKVNPFGGVVIASSVPNSFSSEVMLSRFGSDGKLDPAFGANGRIIVAMAPPEPAARSTFGLPMALWAMPGGGWALLARQGVEFGVGFGSRITSSTMVMRLNSVGGLDESFPQRAPIEYRASRGSFTHLDDGHLLAVSSGTAGCNVVRINTDSARAEGTIIEYYHSRLDHYFITLEGTEAGILDDNVASMGWVRTGQKLGSWAAVELPGAARVCRFYGDLTAGPNSHFYIPQGAGCDELRALEASTPLGTPAWRLEGLTFSTREAFGGQCAENLTPVYRFYNGGFEKGIASNHRYAVDPAVEAEMVAKGWIAEGIAFCMPPAASRKEFS